MHNWNEPNIQIQKAAPFCFFWFDANAKHQFSPLHHLFAHTDTTHLLRKARTIKQNLLDQDQGPWGRVFPVAASTSTWVENRVSLIHPRKLCTQIFPRECLIKTVKHYGSDRKEMSLIKLWLIVTRDDPWGRMRFLPSLCILVFVPTRTVLREKPLQTRGIWSTEV